MINCNDARKNCGTVVPSSCIPYTGSKPSFVDEEDFPCDVNINDVIGEISTEITTILDGEDITELNRRCLPSAITGTIKELHQDEIDALCASQAQLDALQTSFDALNIGSELVTLNLGAMTPITNPCSVTINQYSLFYILNTLVTNINLIKTNLGI